jgi:hypothetical protein
MVSFEDPTLPLALFCCPRGMAHGTEHVLVFLRDQNLTLAVLVAANLPPNVSHCWAPRLFVWAVPSLTKGSSIIFALVPVSNNALMGTMASVFLMDLYDYFSGMLLAFGRLIILCGYSE